MEVVHKPSLTSVEDYLASEESSEIRHDFLGGRLYARDDSSADHNTISLNLAVALRAYLRGTQCRVHVVDVKVRLWIAGEDTFYYPDVMVACGTQDADRRFKRQPQLIVEVLSANTERIDRLEKFLSYTKIDTLAEYVLVAQDKMEVTLFRRANQWRPEVLRLPGDQLGLGSLKFAQPLESIYEGTGL